MHLLLVENRLNPTSSIQVNLSDFLDSVQVTVIAPAELSSCLENPLPSERDYFDGILLHYPDSSSKSSLQQIQQLAPHLPVLAIGDAYHDHHATEALQNGAQDYLEKADLKTRHFMKALHHAIQRQASHQKTESQLQDIHQELGTLYSALSQLFNADRNPHAMSKQIAVAVVGEFGQADCGVMLVDEENHGIIRMERAGEFDVNASIPLTLDGPGLVPRAINSRQTLYIPDVSQDNRYLQNEPRTRSELVIPLKIHERVIGVLDLQSMNQDAFNARDIRILETFAGSAARALENTMLEEMATRLMDKMVLLNRVITLMSHTLNVNSVLRVASEELLHNFGFLLAFAGLRDEQNHLWNINVQIPPLGKTIHLDLSDFFPIPDEEETLIIQTTPIVITDVSRNIAAQPICEAIQQPCQGTMMLIPLSIHFSAGGIIILYSGRPHQFTADEIDLAESVGHSISKFLENSLLHGQLEQHNERLQELVEQRTAELRHLSNRLTAIFNHTGDAVMLIQEDGRFSMVNPAFVSLFGYTLEELNGQTLDILMAPKGKRLSETLAETLRTGKPAYREFTAYCKDGTTFDADMALAPVESHLQGVVCSLRDVTHIKEVERLKDNFIATISHELRNPLTGIVLTVNTLAAHHDTLSEEQRQDSFSRLRQQTGILQELLESMMALSQLKTSMPDRTIHPVDMESLLRDLLIQLQPEFKSAELKLEAEIDVKNSILPGSPLDFTLIWRNLLINAIKYTSRNGKITARLFNVRLPLITPSDLPFNVRVSVPIHLSPGHYLVGQVQDTGYGIPESDRMHIFTRFYRGYAARTKIAGSGLGLPLVKDALARYKGEINVSSVVNEGSTFTFWLPLPAKKESHLSNQELKENIS